MNHIKVYICGPISHYPEGNEPAFRRVHDELDKYGFTVVNPHDLFNDEEKATFSHAQFMERCIERMATCQHIITLAGWMDSEGANQEVDISRIMKKEIISEHHLERWANAIAHFNAEKVQTLNSNA